jgi:hypothetical protein
VTLHKYISQQITQFHRPQPSWEPNTRLFGGISLPCIDFEVRYRVHRSLSIVITRHTTRDHTLISCLFKVCILILSSYLRLGRARGVFLSVPPTKIQWAFLTTNSVAPKPEGSSLRSQELATGPYPEPTESTPHPQLMSLRYILIPSSDLRFCLPSCLFPNTFIILLLLTLIVI